MGLLPRFRIGCTKPTDRIDAGNSVLSAIDNFDAKYQPILSFYEAIIFLNARILMEPSLRFDPETRY